MLLLPRDASDRSDVVGSESNDSFSFVGVEVELVVDLEKEEAEPRVSLDSKRRDFACFRERGEVRNETHVSAVCHNQKVLSNGRYRSEYRLGILLDDGLEADLVGVEIERLNLPVWSVLIGLDGELAPIVVDTVRRNIKTRQLKLNSEGKRRGETERGERNSDRRLTSSTSSPTLQQSTSTSSSDTLLHPSLHLQVRRCSREPTERYLAKSRGSRTFRRW